MIFFENLQKVALTMLLGTVLKKYQNGEFSPQNKNKKSLEETSFVELFLGLK